MPSWLEVLLPSSSTMMRLFGVAFAMMSCQKIQVSRVTTNTIKLMVYRLEVIEGKASPGGCEFPRLPSFHLPFRWLQHYNTTRHLPACRHACMACMHAWHACMHTPTAISCISRKNVDALPRMLSLVPTLHAHSATHLQHQRTPPQDDTEQR